MQGLFDCAHWIAFAVVAAAVLRTKRDWLAMLLVNQVAGLATALQAVAALLLALSHPDVRLRIAAIALVGTLATSAAALAERPLLG